MKIGSLEYFWRQIQTEINNRWSKNYFNEFYSKSNSRKNIHKCFGPIFPLKVFIANRFNIYLNQKDTLFLHRNVYISHSYIQYSWKSINRKCFHCCFSARELHKYLEFDVVFWILKVRARKQKSKKIKMQFSNNVPQTSWVYIIGYCEFRFFSWNELRYSLE